MSIPLLKTANGRAVKSSREELRDALGIPKGKIVISLYNTNSASIPIDSILSALIRTEKNPDGIDPSRLIIIRAEQAKSSDAFANDIKKVGNLLGTSIKPLNLTTLLEIDLRAPGPHFVQNDSVGKMPYVVRAANLHVIGGPVNLFEGLNAGTPTIFFESRSPNFNQNDYREMSTLAEATGGAIKVKTANEFQEAVRSLITNPPTHITPPYLVKTNGKNAFEKYLDALNEILEQALRKP